MAVHFSSRVQIIAFKAARALKDSPQTSGFFKRGNFVSLIWSDSF